MKADNWGVSYGYTDTDGTEHRAEPEIRRRLRDAIGAPADADGSPGDTGAIVTSAGDAWRIHSAATVNLEGGGQLDVGRGWTKPVDFPLGYHSIDIDGQPRRSFIAAPDTCVLPDAFRGWGWAVQLYAMRSYQSWGIGDFADLTTLNRWSAAKGASYTLINPLHAATPTEGQQPSPYFPTSRVWRNPLFLHIEDIPGWSSSDPELADLVQRGRALLDDRRIDRNTVRALKMAALTRLWTNWTKSQAEIRSAFERWRAAAGASIEHFSLYSALVERHGGDTRTWPADLADAHASGVPAAAAELADRVSFHAWVQWLVEGQLAQANSVLPVMTDLAIGVDRAGADAWVWPRAFCRTVSVGAPPDTFNTQGQNWGLPPFNPWRLRDEGYEPFIRTVRAAMTGAGSLRMDHVMGLFRLWWIPEDTAPKDGCYVYMPYRDLTAIVALESFRAGVPVVGEDLGTIEPYVREELTKRKILSYKLVQFETDPTDELDAESMVAITTHDLPTIAGVWTGSDLIDGLLAEVVPNDEGFAEIRSALAERSHAVSARPGVGDLLAPLRAVDRSLVIETVPTGSLGASADLAGLSRAGLERRLRALRQTLSDTRLGDVPAFFEGLLHDLASSPSRIVAATLDDAIYVEERPNLPGTTDERPNWQIALPAPLEVILEHPGSHAVARILGRRPINQLDTPAVDRNMNEPVNQSVTRSVNEATG